VRVMLRGPFPRLQRADPMKSDGRSTSRSLSTLDPMVGGGNASSVAPLGGSEMTKRQHAVVTLSPFLGGLGGRSGMAAR
jgi:hypothetical protein